MNYKVLYRKYRPNDFENVIGQDYIIKTLKNSIINNNISHAYIFSGPRGTGKTSTAKVFAKAINCLNQKNGSPCGTCEFCKNFLENPDIIEIDAASNNGVDQIRNLIDNIKLTPSNGKYKVYIIDEVHMLTTSAFNALLLTLEEPPTHAIFILATTNIENVPITILSRCQRFDFQKITINDIVIAMKDICQKEKIDITDEALNEIAYLSDGGMRDALSLLDQLSKNKEKITIELVENQIKTVSRKSIDTIINSLENNDVETFLKTINDFRIRSVDYKTLCKKIIDGLSSKVKDLKKKNNFNRLTFLDYKNLIIALSDSLIKININVDSYTILEMIFLEYYNNDRKESNKIVDDKPKVELIDNVIDSNINKVTNDIKSFIKKRVNNCFVNAKKEYLEQMKKQITNVCNHIDINGKIKSIFLDSVVVAASDEYVILTSSSSVVENANEILGDIEKELERIINKKYYLIFLTTDEWDNEKNEYIKNVKNGKKYSIIPEEIKSEEEANKINSVFDSSKVEII